MIVDDSFLICLKVLRQFFFKKWGPSQFWKKGDRFPKHHFLVGCRQNRALQVYQMFGNLYFFKIRFQVPPYSNYTPKVSQKTSPPTTFVTENFPKLRKCCPSGMSSSSKKLWRKLRRLFWLFKLPPVGHPKKPMGSTGLGCSASLGAPGIPGVGGFRLMFFRVELFL